MTVCRPPTASDQEITRFHTPDYISFLQSVTPHTMTKFTKADSHYRLSLVSRAVGLLLQV